MDTLSETDRDDYPEPPEHRLWPTLPAGLLAVAGGGCVAGGIFQRYGSTGTLTLRRMATPPDWRLYLGLAIAVAVSGLVAVVGRRSALARTAAGVLAVPAILLAALNAGSAIQTLVPLVRADGVQAIGPGAWLTMGGAAAGLLAALLVFGQAGGYASPGVGVRTPLLAALGATGLLHSWLAGMVESADARTDYLTALTTADHSGAATLAVLGGLGLAAAALGAVSGRRSAVAAGVALGGAVAAGVDLGVRLATVQRLLDAGDGLVRRQETFITLAATMLVLLLLAVMLRGRPVPSPEEEHRPLGRPGGADRAFGDSPFEPVGGPGFDRPGFDRPGFDRPGFDRPDFDRPGFHRPGFGDPGPDQPGFGGSPYEDGLYEPAGFERRQEAGYVPEHDPAPGTHYPLVPDERAAHHPAPPRPGASRPPED